ncbi:CPBP family intramembrane glutamic endopeptidase [Anaerosporobacter sp.]|uniref:CPBP family intramembrane glutamic endopeptidase n=1 Tax=Anaerosporobacter sp. TaxID=1872529 RepID=UPI00286F958D|nr:type II CAAX endopeptidase family protein [Anaerosporobacter sp.]
MKENIKKKDFGIRVIVGFVIFFAVFFGGDWLVGKSLYGVSNKVGGTCLRVSLGILCSIYTAKVLKIKIGFKRDDFFRGLMMQTPIWLIAVFFSVINVVKLSGKMTTSEFFVNCAVWSVYALAVGFFEEVLCRGLLLNGLCVMLEGKKNPVIVSIVLSSLIFGALHFINVIDGSASFIETAIQVVYTTVGGIVFAMAYKRSNTIWSTIVVHGFLDFAVFMGKPF